MLSTSDDQGYGRDALLEPPEKVTHDQVSYIIPEGRATECVMTTGDQFPIEPDSLPVAFLEQ
jgi:hypothetical protein